MLQFWIHSSQVQRQCKNPMLNLAIHRSQMISAFCQTMWKQNMNLVWSWKNDFTFQKGQKFESWKQGRMCLKELPNKSLKQTAKGLFGTHGRRSWLLKDRMSSLRYKANIIIFIDNVNGTSKQRIQKTSEFQIQQSIRQIISLHVCGKVID